MCQEMNECDRSIAPRFDGKRMRKQFCCSRLVQYEPFHPQRTSRAGYKGNFLAAGQANKWKRKTKPSVKKTGCFSRGMAVAEHKAGTRRFYVFGGARCFGSRHPGKKDIKERTLRKCTGVSTRKLRASCWLNLGC